MKKLSSYFFAVVLAASIASCANDGSEGGVSSTCSMEGNWVVKSADVTSEKLDKTVLEMSKELILQTTYVFTSDSVTVNTGGVGGVYKGAYKLDADANSLSWSSLNPNNGFEFKENMVVKGCNDKVITLLKRTPADTTQPAVIKGTLILERSN